MDAESFAVVVALTSGASAMFSFLLARVAARRTKLLAARIRAGEVIAYLTSPVGAADMTALCVIDNRATERISDVVVRYQDSDLCELPELRPWDQQRVPLPETLGSIDTQPTTTAPQIAPSLAFSDTQGRRWTSDTQGLRLAEETGPPHKSTKLNRVPLTWLVWTSAATGLITVIPILLYFAIL
ncbi:hypothetical protein [Streptomyces sp. CBMA152]|uniref:hypothetical protein n=1 Tax=Streptomyces sp. CBMA152 TaxID=1896312 RepID=UPI00166080BD|nr:hypothetical protein [Streptomyces sp. CBMA152]